MSGQQGWASLCTETDRPREHRRKPPWTELLEHKGQNEAGEVADHRGLANAGDKTEARAS